MEPNHPDLRELARAAEQLATDAGLASVATALRQNRAERDRTGTRVAVVGDVKRGKSTLTNRLIGADLIPTGEGHRIAIPVVVRGIPIGPVTLELLGSSGTTDRHPVAPGDAWPMPVVPGGDGSGTTRPTAVLSAVSPWLIETGLELIDTAGWGEGAVEELRPTQQAVASADVVVMTISATSPLSLSERRFLAEELLARHVPRVIIVLTMVDYIGNDAEEFIAWFRDAVHGLSPVVAVVVGPGPAPAGELELSGLRTRIAAFLRSGDVVRRRDRRLARQVADACQTIHDAAELAAAQLLSDEEARQPTIAAAKRALAEADQQWSQLHLDLEGRRLGLLEKVRESLSAAASELFELMGAELRRVNDIKNWWELELPVRLPRELRNLAHTLELQMRTTVSRDLTWLDQEVARSFQVRASRVGELAAPFTPIGPRPVLKLGDARHRHAATYIARAVGAVVGALLAAATHVQFALPAAGSTLATLVADYLTQARTDEERVAVRRELRRLIDDVVDQFRANLGLEIDRIYQNAFDELRTGQETWRTARIEALVATDAPDRDLTTWTNVRHRAEQIAAQLPGDLDDAEVMQDSPTGVAAEMLIDGLDRTAAEGGERMNPGPSVNGFGAAEIHRRRLRAILADVTAVASDLEATNLATLTDLSDRLASDAFRVMVVGDFKRGKSTLVNAVLGENVLPAYSRPATAVLTELYWSATPRAVLHPATGGAPVQIEMDALSQHITIPKGIAQGAAETSPWKLAEVGWPLDLLRDGVILVDSPGLNEHPVRQAMTIEYLRRADAIVFVQDCQHATSIDESHFMKVNLDSYDPLFFVFNKINFIPDHELAEVREDITEKVRDQRGDPPRDRFYFVNALGALEARQRRDDAGWRGSGVADFLDDLTGFLTTDRHRVKVTGPARDVSREILGLRHIVLDKQALIDQEEGDLRRRFAQAEKPLQELEQRVRAIRAQLNQAQDSVVHVVRTEVAQHLERLSTEIDEIVAGVTPESKLALTPWKAKGAAEAYGAELARRVSNEATLRFKTWQRNELNTIIVPRLTYLAATADTLVGQFMRDLASLREGLTGITIENTVGDVSVFGGTDMGFAAGGLGVQLASRFGGTFLAVLLVGVFAPFGFVALIVGALLTGAAKGQIERTLRREIGPKIADQIRSNADENAEKCATLFGQQIGAAMDEVVSRIDRELAQVRQEVLDALATLAQGADAVAQQRAQLAHSDEALRQYSEAVEDLIGDVVRL
jgi:predicted GTPase